MCKILRVSINFTDNIAFFHIFQRVEFITKSHQLTIVIGLFSDKIECKIWVKHSLGKSSKVIEFINAIIQKSILFSNKTAVAP